MENSINYIGCVTDNHIAEVSKRENEYMENALKDKLGTLGYTFEDKPSFYQFISDRLTRIDQDENTFEVRMDYVDEVNPGNLVMKCHTEIDTDFKGTTINTTVTFKIT